MPLQYMIMFTFKLLLVLLFPAWVLTSNILGVFTRAARSHHILGEILLKELATRGHNVTMVSSFPLRTPFPNYTDIYLDGINDDKLDRNQFLTKVHKKSVLGTMSHYVNSTRTQTITTLTHPEVKKLIECGTKFDVVIIDWYINEGLLLFGNVLDAPVIPIASFGTSYVAVKYLGNPLPASYVPFTLLPFTENMTFFQRVINTVVLLIVEVLLKLNIRYYDSLIKTHLKDAPNIYDIMKDNIAVILTNGHYSYESPRPLLPNVIPIGGFHVQKAGKLSQDVQDFMDRSKRGVVYFSLGTNIDKDVLSEEKMRDILKAFSKVPYEVLVKWDPSALQDKYDNVMAKEWLQQNDVLAHPKVKLFISHGGILSMIETIYHGVPIIGLPMFGDQKSNVAAAVHNGFALQLDIATLTEENLLKTILEVTRDPIYTENAKKRSHLLRDQPESPMNRAVFWVEHVIRHKGAPHLRNQGINLNWYQYYLLDVYLFLVVALAFILALIYYSAKVTFKFVIARITFKRQKVD